jgi:hypothetical protein
MERARTVPVSREQAVWLTEDEAFALLIGLVRGAALGSESEDALLEKIGEVCRSFLRDGRQLPLQVIPEDIWVFATSEERMSRQAA